MKCHAAISKGAVQGKASRVLAQVYSMLRSILSTLHKAPASAGFSENRRYLDRSFMNEALPMYKDDKRDKKPRPSSAYSEMLRA